MQGLQLPVLTAITAAISGLAATVKMTGSLRTRYSRWCSRGRGGDGRGDGGRNGRGGGHRRVAPCRVPHRRGGGGARGVHGVEVIFALDHTLHDVNEKLYLPERSAHPPIRIRVSAMLQSYPTITRSEVGPVVQSLNLPAQSRVIS